MPKPTEEQILSILNTVARKWSKRSNGRFEVGELVNEVWCMGAVQRISNIKMVWARVQYDMFEYMRRYSKWRYQGIWRDKVVRQEDVLKNNIKTTTQPSDRAEEREQIDFLTEGLDRKEELLVRLFAEGFNSREAARITGYHETWVSWMVLGKNNNLQQHLKNRYLLQKQG